MIMKTILNRFPTFGQRNKFNWNSFFWLFEKIWFFLLWLNIYFQKNENFQKWEKMVSDGIFELAIANLVGFDLLFVKID